MFCFFIIFPIRIAYLFFPVNVLFNICFFFKKGNEMKKGGELIYYIGCYNMTTIEISNCVSSIGPKCFSRWRNLKTINIPNGVSSIGKSCFEGCFSLKTINIPSSVSSIGDNCFERCEELKKIQIDSNNPIYYTLNGHKIISSPR